MRGLPARMLAGAGFLGLAGLPSAAWAGMGQPSPWQMGLQTPATPIAQNTQWFHDAILLPIITVISLFVLLLLVLVVAKFRASKNPVPSKTTHHAGLEVAWTLIPVLILAAIVVPSFRLLREQITIPKPDITIKATGYAWYWKFTYPQDSGGFEFEVRMLSDEERVAAVKAGKGKEADFPRLLAVDNEVVVPVNKTVAVQVTAGDVLHAFAVPSFAVKIDAVPGRLNQTWFRATKEGIFYGQCSELCGKDHAFMPLAIRVVSQEKYDAWLADAKKKYARIGDAPVQTALTDQAR
ncbi:MAG: cytochrome c oxidase subunit II [Methylobacterium sp.]|nr:cytochrome c oxidase subunit II [Methylobacterium sp.]MCA3601189.1 cytochrome c oxidase subunit II [Methylobacterium sp.]MCA3605926.1 cytochrome c oxidase subunit II [Methylobacterium sp.]MCA3609239.1 cytochrome c oxidase subunit II [Methylobacterium sp.]MCA3610843.1 cytochrome c oxidase subunit II [Methylobacterium sp.]